MRVQGAGGRERESLDGCKMGAGVVVQVNFSFVSVCSHHQMILCSITRKGKEIKDDSLLVDC